MKRNIQVLVVIFLTAILTGSSCKKSVLDTQPFDRVSDEVVWSNTANAETFIFNTYNLMYNLVINTVPTSDLWTTNSLAGYTTYNNAATVFQETLDKTYDIGFNNWAEVRRCNQIITQVGASTGISATDKGRLIAEGKFLRAMSYFNVARKIGRIVWIDKVLNPTDNLLLPSTANPTESYKYIIKDLEDAEAGLPTDQVPGRANKYTAAAFLSEVCLEALAYENYPADPKISPDDPLLAEAITNAQLVINQGGYALESDYGSMFDDGNPTSSEIIFGIYQKAINTTCDGTFMQRVTPNISNDQVNTYGGSPLFVSPIHVFEGWVEHGPTQNLADDYLVKDQNSPSLALPWNKTSQYLNAINENASIPTSIIPQAAGETSVESGMIKPGSNETIWSLTNNGRDARWEASILADSTTKHYGEILTTTIKGNATRWLLYAGSYVGVTFSNMYWRKSVYKNVNPRIYYGVPTDYHHVVMRLGRVYLNLAEAYLLKGDVPDAVAALNETRTVHGQLPPSTASTLADAWTDYKRERRVDLTLEEDYYWSLLRWGRYGGNANHGTPSGGAIPELNEVPRVIDISKDRKAFSVVKGSFYGSNNIRKFDNTRRYLFPIAQYYLDENPKFGPQNPGW